MTASGAMVEYPVGYLKAVAPLPTSALWQFGTPPENSGNPVNSVETPAHMEVTFFAP
jgi:hypothetical protein